MAGGNFGLYQSGGIPGIQFPSVSDGGGLFQHAFNSFAEIKKGKSQPKVDGAKSDVQRILEANEKNRLREEGLISRMLSPEFQRQQLENKLAFDKQQMAQAAPYKLAFALPGQIMDAAVRPASIALAGKMMLAEGITGGANIMANAASNIPNLTKYQRSPQGFASRSYF
jgi:hypothetical protein